MLPAAPPDRRQGRLGAAGRRRAGRVRPAGSTASPPTSPRLHGAGQRGDHRLLRRRSRSAGGRLRPAARRAAARAEAGRRRRSGRSSWPGPGGEAWRRTACTTAQILITLEDTESAAALPERARAPWARCSPRRRAGGQRERHGRHERDPLRRQRPAVGAGRGDGAAPTRWCCCPTWTASTPPTRARTRRPATCRGRRRSRPRSRRWPAARSRRRHRRHGEQAESPPRSRPLPAARSCSAWAACRAPAGGAGGGARCTLFARADDPPRRARTGSPRSLGVVRRAHVDAGAVAALRRGSSLLPAGVTRGGGRLRARRRGADPVPGRRPWPRACPPTTPRTRGAAWAAHRGDRSHPGLSRPRRAGSPGRPGAA